MRSRRETTMGSSRQAGRRAGIAAIGAGARVEGSGSGSAGSRRGVMRAVVQEAYGAADVLHLAEIDRPDIAANEALVQVRGAGVDRGTWHQMTGRPYLMRVIGFGLRGPKQRVPGPDVAGTIVAVGSPGDQVPGRRRGVRHCPGLVRRVRGRPTGQARPQARQPRPPAGRRGCGLGGHRPTGSARRRARPARAAGAGHRGLRGVGTFAVQLAKAFGAQVTGVCSTAKVDLVRSLGADQVIDYTREDFADGVRRYDLILDIGGDSRLSRLRRALASKGTLVIVGGEGGKWIGMARQLRALVLSPFVRQRLTMFIARQRQADLEALRQFIEAGQVAPIVGAAYPLAEVPDALRHLEAGQARGKLAITI
jgi:NADPH:quinone reductase-like Zn-dependent oxidoreductase